MEEDNREILRLLRDNSTQDKLEGLKRLIALSALPLKPRLGSGPNAGLAERLSMTIAPPANTFRPQ